MSKKLLPSGDRYLDGTLHLIKNAEKIIHLHTYTFALDKTGNQILEALINAHKKGVNVFVLIDSVGSLEFSDEKLEELNLSGLHIRKFSTIKKSWRAIGHRLHHKILAVDSEHVIVGGNNIGNDYMLEGKKLWLDYSVLISNQILAQSLTNYCQQIFQKEKIDYTDLDVESKVTFDKNNWIDGYSQIYSKYLKLIEEAKNSILISASYFLPDKKILAALKKASERGVKITLILPGKSDVKIFLLAMHSYYAWCEAHKIEIYEWKATNLHTKLLIVDKSVSSIGSYNLNSISKYNSLELNASIYDKQFCNELITHLQKQLEKGAIKIENPASKTTSLSKIVRLGFSLLAKLGQLTAQNHKTLL